MSDLMNQDEELRIVANSIADWLPNHPYSTVAVLVPTNEQGHQVVDALKKKQVAYSDTLLRATNTSRTTAGALDHVLIYLADPHDAAKLSKVYEVWRRATRNDNEASRQVLELSGKLRQCRRVEDFLWPQPDRDWLANQKLTPDQKESLGNFRELVRRWQEAVLLPIDQLIISLAQDLFSEPDKLATAHKLAPLC